MTGSADNLQTSRDVRRDFGGACRDRVYSNAGNSELVDLIPAIGIRNALDVGCGTGSNARLLKLRCPGARVTGITVSEAEAEAAECHCDDVFVADIQDPDSFEPKTEFDAIILSHVLEHLIDAAQVLVRLKNWLSAGGSIYVALPNIAFCKLRIEALLGRFDYTPAGIMDSTHVHFYTYDTARKLIEDAGFLVEDQKASGMAPLRPIRSVFPGAAKRIDKISGRLFPNLFGWQTIIKARPQMC